MSSPKFSSRHVSKWHVLFQFSFVSFSIKNLNLTKFEKISDIKNFAGFVKRWIYKFQWQQCSQELTHIYILKTIMENKWMELKESYCLKFQKHFLMFPIRSLALTYLLFYGGQVTYARKVNLQNLNLIIFHFWTI